MSLEPTAGPAECAECGSQGKLVGGQVIYPHRVDLHELKFWLCDCGAYVGCHRPGVGMGNGSTPLGTMAGLELRDARKKAHALFDPLWRTRRLGTRRKAYALLAKVLSIPVENCHISQMDLQTVRRIQEVLPQLQKMRG